MLFVAEEVLSESSEMGTSA